MESGFQNPCLLALQQQKRPAAIPRGEELQRFGLTPHEKSLEDPLRDPAGPPWETWGLKKVLRAKLGSESKLVRAACTVGTVGVVPPMK
jgi:hypothetical protein